MPIRSRGSGPEAILVTGTAPWLPPGGAWLIPPAHGGFEIEHCHRDAPDRWKANCRPLGGQCQRRSGRRFLTITSPTSIIICSARRKRSEAGLRGHALLGRGAESTGSVSRRVTGHGSGGVGDDQNRAWRALQFRYQNGVAAQQFFYAGCSVVAVFKPHDPRRGASGRCEFKKIRVGRYDDEPVRSSVLPNDLVRGEPRKARLENVR